MKSFLFVTAIAMSFISPLSAQKNVWTYTSVTEHLSVKFPADHEKKSQQYEVLSAESKKGVHKVFCTNGNAADSIVSFQTFTDSLTKNAGKCCKVNYVNRSVNNDSIIYLDLILTGCSRGNEGVNSKVSYMRIFEYSNNLYCLYYSENSSKIKKSVFTKNKLFTSIVYKPDLNSRRRGINVTSASQFASFISCALR